MRSVRNEHGFIWVAGLLLIVWACGGSAGSPTAPANFASGEIYSADASCGSPPCGGGGGGGGGKKAQDIDWTVSVSGGLTANAQNYSMPSASSMDFDHFAFVSDNVGFEQLQYLGEPGFNVCFVDTFYTADDLIVHQDPKSGELHADYRFGGQRLSGEGITYSIVFRDLQITSPTGEWPPGVGTLELTGRIFDVTGVAQKNNTCNASNVDWGADIVFTLIGGVPSP